MTGCPPARSNRLDTIHKRNPFHLTFHSVPSNKMKHIPLSKRNIQTKRSYLLQMDSTRTGIGQMDCSGNNILLLIHTIKKLRFQTGDRVFQSYRECLCFAVPIESRRHSRNGIFSCAYFMSDIIQINTSDTIICNQIERTKAEIPCIGSTILLWQQIHRPAALYTQLIWIGRKSAVSGNAQILHCPFYFAAIVEMDKMTQITNSHLVGCTSGCQSKNFSLIIIMNTHSIYTPLFITI